VGTSFVRERYEILSVLGHGGQGQVARALDHQHDRIVALKILEVGSEFERRGLLREARMLLSLQPHPGLPIVREDFFDEDRYFIVMDWVEGVSLSHVLADRGAPGLPPPEVVEYASQAAAALDHLHRHEPPVVHQDVKPGNLILVPDGHVVLVDFGLSVPGGSEPGRVVGTRGFAAPEVAAGTTTASADVYGLAATAFALLTGGPPKGDLPTWENIPRGAAGRIEPVIRRALSIDPDRRHPSAGVFATDLAGAVGARSGARVGVETQIRTFLIADVRGYTSFTKEHGDEAAARLAAAFAEIAREGVEAREGEVIELRGDEALAVFPSARQALRAAAELQVVFEDESRLDPSLPLAVGVGLDAGEAVPVEGGFRGAALNLAARLCASAGPGEVLASQGVVHLAGAVDGVRLEERVPLDLRGMDAPVPAWQAIHDDALTGPIGTRPAQERSARPVLLLDVPPELDPLTGLVGRDRDARWIRWAWRQARRGPGRIVVITGVEGAGKTLLAAEVAQMAAREGAPTFYASARRSPAEIGRAIAAAGGASDPTLLVLDDLDVAGDAELSSLAELIDELDERRLLVVGLLRDGAPPRSRAALERLAGSEDRIRRIGPFDRDGVRAVAALYLEESNSEVPVDAILQTTGGAPAEVHRMAVRWAEGETARRLGGAADLAARGRSGLRTAEAELVDTVIDLQRVRAREDLLAGPGDRLVADLPPFKGLVTFDASDAGYFFGRERLVAEMVARLAGSSFLGVVGPSGSGKSSAVRAGLLPALASGALPDSEGWIRALLRPGEHPERELDRVVYAALPERLRNTRGASQPSLESARSAIVEDRGHLLLVVDQAEELFTICRDDAERTRFLGALTSAVRDRDVTIVFALRADFYGRCAEHPELAELVAENHVLVGPMSGEEYRRAIELPARRAGLRIDRPLVDALVDEVVDEPGGLPLLSTTLLELWQHRQGRAIRLESYSETGGVRGAVARLAEQTYGVLTAEQQALARGVLLRLSAGVGDVVTRRRVPIQDFDPDTNVDVRAVLDNLIEARLLTADEGSVEVAHEALLREWPRLEGWLEEDRAGRRLREHLTEQAKDWDSSGKDSGDLYRGARLVSALDWTAEHAAELNDLERDFLSQSRAASDRETEQQRRTNRRLRGLLAGVAVFLVVALVAGGLALVQRGRARDEASRAESQTRFATARELANAAVTNLAEDPDLAILLALRAVEETRSAGEAVLPEAEEALHRAVIASRIDLRLDRAGTAADMSPDGSLIATGRSPDAPGVVALRDAESGEVLSSWEAHAPRVNDVAFAPDGSVLATAGDDGSIALWDPRSRDLVRRLAGPEPTEQVWAIAFPPDARRVAGIWWNSDTQPKEGLIFDTGTATVRIFDVRSGRLIRAIAGMESPLRYIAEGLAFSPDGSRLAVADDDDIVRIVDTDTGRVITSLARTPGFGTAPDVAWSPDGRTLATTTSGSIWVWDGESYEPRFSIETDAQAIAWSADGARLATLGADRAKIWDVFDYGARLMMSLPTRAVVQVGWESIAFDPEGGRLLTADNDGLIQLWDIGVTGDQEWLNIPAQGEWWRGDVTYSPDGRAIVSSVLTHRRVRIWDAKDGHAIETFAGHGDLGVGQVPGVATVAVSPDGSLVASAARDSLLKVWSVESGEEVFTFADHVTTDDEDVTWIEDVEFSPDGSVVATGSLDGTARIVDVATQRQLLSLEHPDQVISVAFSPDGRSLATGCQDGSARIWDVRNGRLLATIPVGAGIQAVDFSPDGVLLAAGSQDGKATVWNVGTRTQISTLEGHAAEVLAVAFSPDGSSVATGSGDNTVRLWDPRTGVAKLVLRGHTLFIRNLSFNPDGTRLASLGGEGVIRVWALDLDDLVHIARDALTRSFTPEECGQYLHDRCPPE